MTKRKTNATPGGTLTNIRKSTLAHRGTTMHPTDYDTTIETRRRLMELGYIKPGDSQYDKRLLKPKPKPDGE